MSKASQNIFGVLAEFSGAETLVRAAERVREAGYNKYDCHSPFPVHGMDKAMGLGRSPLGYWVGIASTVGLIGITLFIWWVSAVDYPLVISGKELFSFQAFVPPIFAIAILAAAITATVGMLVFNRLPRLHHPLFSSKEFDRVTDGGFFVSIEADDPAFEKDKTTEFLKSIGAVRVEVVEDQ
ncbi:MAG: DUF3341 domain-containing protein [candidate division Zixibacteria bacterium]|nr:DUF3341 domain-containing protein [candidate division Zixibacteria bacterium]